MEPVNVTPAAQEAFQKFYAAELDSRVQRSEVVGAITLAKGNAAVFYDQESGKFTLVEKPADAEVAHVYDCESREQWGRTVMLFGHATPSGAFIPSGHATLDGNTLKIKLASGKFYRITVDAALAPLQPFVCNEPPKPLQTKPANEKRKPERTQRKEGRATKADKPSSPPPPRAANPDDECEDLTEEDLRRLRGEIPLSRSPKKKWKH